MTAGKFFDRWGKKLFVVGLVVLGLRLIIAIATPTLTERRDRFRYTTVEPSQGGPAEKRFVDLARLSDKDPGIVFDTLRGVKCVTRPEFDEGIDAMHAMNEAFGRLVSVNKGLPDYVDVITHHKQSEKEVAWLKAHPSISAEVD